MPIEELIGPGVKAQYLNDNALGRALEDIVKYGSTQLFGEIAFQCVTEAGLMTSVNHLDSTLVTLYGYYAYAEESGVLPCLGYSKGQRPDLKQVVVNLITSGSVGVPLWVDMQNGNRSDKTQFY